MNGERNSKKLTLKIPVIKAESETQTFGQLVSRSPDKIEVNEMETAQQTQMSLRKRRNLSKSKGQATRQREKTPEPSRTPVPHEDTTTSDDEEIKPVRSSREIEADNTYEEMKRLVHEKANVKDPVYDLDIEEVLEARAIAANERRRRSISPFAIPDKEELYKMERKGSFIDPNNKLLSTTYCVSPKDEDNGRRNSLTIETPRERANSLTPPLSSSASPKDKEFPYPTPTTPKKLEEFSYSDENCDKQIEGISKNSSTPVKKDKVFNFDQKDERNSDRKPSTASTKTSESSTSGELVTKVIQVERTPSKKLSQENKPTVEIRERVVRTPSRKMSTDIKPIIAKQNKQKEELQNRAPPIKPARSKSASKFGGKTSESETSEDQVNLKILAAATTRRTSRTSESEMSEDQTTQTNLNTNTTKRKVVPTPRRFQKNKSPRANRSHSVNRIEDVKVLDKTGTGMSQTSREILELMQKARARSLSIPKDDPRLIAEYKGIKNLQTPNKTPSTSRSSRGISCPKTIQIISDKEILLGLANKKLNVSHDKSSRHNSGYIDASQSEYTSSCYSSSPSENEYDFDLTERTAELTRKLNLLSEEVDKKEAMSNIILSNVDYPRQSDIELKSVLRKRSLTDIKNETKKESKRLSEDKKVKTKPVHDKYNKLIKSRWKFIANWQQFKVEQKSEYEKLKQLRNRCVCNLLLLVILCGLGGMMFKTLEGSFENAYKCSTRNVKRDFIESLWRGSHYLREEDWKSMARKKLYEFENQLHTAHEAGVTSYSGQRSWNFMNSFVYCLTLITTIGYGHIAPKTTYGRIATIAYAIIGIPLFLIVLADFGKLFTRIIKFFWAFIRRFYYTRSCRKVRRTVPVQEVMKGLNIMYEVVRRPSQMFSEEDMGISPEGEQPPPVERKPSDVPPPLPPKPGTIKDIENDTEPDTPVPSVFEIDDEFNVPISVAIFILVVYLIIGAVGYNMWETWTFFESFYFVFISMSTIGLGDLVPDHPMFMMASILYLVFGLALTSMCINVVQVKLSDTFKQASAKLGATIGLQVSDEDGSLVPITPTKTEVVPVHKPKNVSEGEDGKSKEEEKTENDSKNR